MGKQRKKAKVKLSRKKKNLIRKEKEGITAEETSKISESKTSQYSLNENSKLFQSGVGPISDVEEKLTEDNPNLIHRFTDEEETGSELHTVEKIWQWLNLSPYLIAGLIFLFFAAFAFALYGPAIKGPFVFDDIRNILERSAIRLTEFSFTGLKKVAIDGLISTRPVANITFALNYLIDGYNVNGYHIFNIIVHAINGFLLFLLFRLTLKLIKQTEDNPAPIALPFIAALVWFVHPLHSQSVAYVVQRMNSMAAMFYILALLCYVRARLAGSDKSKYPMFACSIVSGLLAIGTKENSAALPFFIFLYEWYFFQNLDYKWLIQKKVYIIGVLIISMAVALVYLGNNPMDRILSGYQIRDFTLEQRVLTQFRIVFFYISQLILPHPSRLSLQHDFPLSYSFFNPPTTILSIGALLFILGMAIYIARKHRLASFAILWFFGNLFIESSFIPLEIIFEHRTYLPSMFFILTVTVLAAKLIKIPKLKIAVSCLIIVILSFWTFERSRVWGDDELLMRDCVAKSPNKSRVYTNLGYVLVKKGDLDEALENFYTALKINPYDEKAYSNIGDVFNNQGKYDDAIKYYNIALTKNGFKDKRVTFHAYFGLGDAYARKFNFEKAIYYYNIIIQVNPTSDHARTLLQKAKKMLHAQKMRKKN